MGLSMFFLCLPIYCQVTQEICDKTRTFRLLGSDRWGIGPPWDNLFSPLCSFLHMSPDVLAQAPELLQENTVHCGVSCCISCCLYHKAQHSLIMIQGPVVLGSRTSGVFQLGSSMMLLVCLNAVNHLIFWCCQILWFSSFVWTSLLQEILALACKEQKAHADNNCGFANLLQLARLVNFLCSF